MERTIRTSSSASYDWYPKGININARTGLVQGIIGKDGKQIRPGKGFFEARDASSLALNELVCVMRQALKDLHGPYVNTDSYYCQLPDETVLGPDEGYPENSEILGDSTLML
ncbi:hypothetical protein [Pseudomonas sp. ANT_J28]|uniref:hypothetical protein n=1 Tax=Pseudomonas sp. ANT_J28 TaxID=2597352 RepID=UPI0011F3DCFB|nr:hypothetical protein [Pseudomonas sp. ANT_J28]KAA0974836.1 hypothetical protein FQ187_28520 [Pseudomonas sp. ANT_J28]